MRTKNGVVSSIKIIKYSEPPLVFFKIDDKPCLIANRSLSFLADVDDGMRIAVAGDYNTRNQFVVKRYGVIGETKIMIEFKKLSV